MVNRVATDEGVKETTLKGGDGRTLALDDDVVAALRSWQEGQRLDEMLAGAGWAGSDKVFTDEHGRALNPSAFRAAWEAALRESGARKIRPHDLRHTHAALLIAAGVHPKAVQERLGHANIATTLDIYGHLFPEMQRDAAKRAADLLRGRAE